MLQLHRLLFSVGMVVLAMSFAQCKTPNQSQVKSLDNFSRGSDAQLKINACSGSYGKDFDLYWGENASSEDRIVVESPLKDQLKDSIQSALTAVPDGLQDWFFDKGGKLIFTTEASQMCGSEAYRKQMLTENVEGYSGCWSMENGQFPKIYINVDPAVSRIKFEGSDDLEVVKKDIGHSVVRSFGYVVSQVLTKLKPKADNPSEFVLENGDPAVQKDRELLAWKFIVDVREQIKAGNGDVSLGIYGSLIQSEKVLDPSTEYQEAWRNWFIQYKSYNSSDQSETPKEGQWADRARNFQDFVFAETFDTYYCNESTKQLLVGDNPVFTYTGVFFDQVIGPALQSAFAVREEQGKEGEVVAEESDDQKPGSEEAPSKLNEEEDAGKLDLVEETSEESKPGEEMVPGAPNEGKIPEFGLVGWRYPILNALFAVRGAIAYTGRAVATWARNRNQRVSNSLVRGQPVRNLLRIVNGGPAGWRIQRWRETGGFRPIQRAQRGCLIRRWRC